MNATNLLAINYKILHDKTDDHIGYVSVSACLAACSVGKDLAHEEIPSITKPVQVYSTECLPYSI